VEASINLDAFDPEDLDDEELNENVGVISPVSIASSAFYSAVREVSFIMVLVLMSVPE
jgi:hypothetical protein